MKEYLAVIYSFYGRLTRGQYIARFLGVLVGGAILAFLFSMAGQLIAGEKAVMIVVVAFTSAMWISILSLDVRRLHDMNCSGWWMIVIVAVAYIWSYFFTKFPAPNIALIIVNYCILYGPVLAFIAIPGTKED